VQLHACPGCNGVAAIASGWLENLLCHLFLHAAHSLDFVRLVIAFAKGQAVMALLEAAEKVCIASLRACAPAAWVCKEKVPTAMSQRTGSSPCAMRLRSSLQPSLPCPWLASLATLCTAGRAARGLAVVALSTAHVA
jgi:hypothetical protein